MTRVLCWACVSMSRAAVTSGGVPPRRAVARSQDDARSSRSRSTAPATPYWPIKVDSLGLPGSATKLKATRSRSSPAGVLAVAGVRNAATTCLKLAVVCTPPSVSRGLAVVVMNRVKPCRRISATAETVPGSRHSRAPASMRAMNAVVSRACVGAWPVAARIATATARSASAPIATPAGVMWMANPWWGQVNPAEWKTARSRARSWSAGP